MNPTRPYKFEEKVSRMLESLKTKGTQVECEGTLIERADTFSKKFPDSIYSTFYVDEFCDSFLVFVSCEDFLVAKEALEKLSKKILDVLCASWSGAQEAGDVEFQRYSSGELQDGKEECLIFTTFSFVYESRPVKISLVVPYDLVKGDSGG